MAETTIKDIARMCGCSVSTVSRALNNHPDINPETRKKIMQIVKETGFVPNNSAIQLKKSDTKAVALLVKGITNQFFNPMIRTMEDYTQQMGYSTILRHVEAEDDEVQVALQLIKEKKLKGIVFLGGNFVHNEEMLHQLNVPFVFSTIGAPRGETWYANVSVDDRKEAEKAVNYLIDQGHSKIAIIGDALTTPSVSQLRYEGYRHALQTHHIDFRTDLVEEAESGEAERFTMENGYKMTWKLLHSGADFTGLFCTADVFAIGASRAVIDSGLRIPEDISVVGFDGSSDCQRVVPVLTSVYQNNELRAKMAMELLLKMLQDSSFSQSVCVPVKLVWGESVRNLCESGGEK